MIVAPEPFLTIEETKNKYTGEISPKREINKMELEEENLGNRHHSHNSHHDHKIYVALFLIV